MPNRYSAAQKRASEKYLSEKVEDIRIRVPKGEKAQIKAAADAAGESVNAYILTAIRARMRTPADPEQ